MRRARLLALAAAGAAALACSSGPPTVGARLAGPASAVAFAGVTSKDPTNPRHPYLAVASARGDELRMIDLLDDQPVVGPAMVFPLSVGTAPTPLLVAAAPLGDASARSDGQGDLLVAVSAGRAAIQVVETWDRFNRVPAELAVPIDAPLGADAVLSLAALTIPGGARVLAGTSGGKLIVVDFARAEGGAVRAAGAPAVQTLGFAPVDLAIETDPPSTPGANRIFAASRDAIGAGAGGAAVHGVAQIQMAPQATVPWTSTALDARAPTRAVAVARVVERTTADPNLFGDPNADPLGAGWTRVYAALDPSGCGPDKPIACGVATLLPGPRGAGRTTDLAPDPARPADPQAFRAPMAVPGVTDAIAIVLPASNGSERLTADNPPSGFSPAAVPLMYASPLGGRTVTTAVAAASSSDGHVYLLDLGRWTPLDDVNPLQGANRVAMTSVTSTGPTPGAAIGVWTDFPAATAGTDAVAVTTNPAQVERHVQLTPGFTPADTFTIAWQGALSPALKNRQGIVTSSGGVVYAAVQTTVVDPSTGAQRTLVGARIGDPSLGVRDGDLVDLTCPGGVPASAKVRGAPLAAAAGPFPGGAIAIGALDGSDAPICGVTRAASSTATVTLTVRASGYVLSGAALGYVGRPERDKPYLEFTHDPALDVPGAPASEALARARLARRLFYPASGPCASGSSTDPCAAYPWLAADPLGPIAPGPALAFKIGLVDATTESQLPPGAAITFTTQSGFAPTNRVPTTGGAVPVKSVPFDRTTYQDRNGALPYQNDPVRFYTPFLDDQVLDLSPSRTQAEVNAIR